MGSLTHRTRLDQLPAELDELQHRYQLTAVVVHDFGDHRVVGGVDDVPLASPYTNRSVMPSSSSPPVSPVLPEALTSSHLPYPAGMCVRQIERVQWCPMTASNADAARRRWADTTPAQRARATEPARRASIERRATAMALLAAVETAGLAVNKTEAGPSSAPVGE